jgi:ketosteroid isomerase-like protein
MFPGTAVRALLTAGLVVALGGPAGAAVNKSGVAAQVKRAAAATVAGINAHDPARATAFEADDVVFMQPEQPNTFGRASDLAGFKKGFADDPAWRVSLVEEHVDVAASGDLAIYRSIYNEDGSKDGVPMTHKVNFVAEFKRQADGSWKMPWYVVSPLERSHKK